MPSVDASEAVCRALAEVLGLDVEALRERLDQDLADLGLDSTGLLRVLLAVERGLHMDRQIAADDADLATPRTLIAAVARQAGCP